MTKLLGWLAAALVIGAVVFWLVPGAPDLSDELGGTTGSDAARDAARNAAADRNAADRNAADRNGADRNSASRNSASLLDTPQGATSTGEFTVGQRLPPAMMERASEYPEIEWDSLMPADWDPLEIFQDLDIDALDDADPRAIEALETLRAAWDEAPTNDTLDGTAGRIAGFLVPLDWQAESFGEFLLVPYFGACIHTPPPPANQIIHVIADPPVTGQGMMEAIWVEGRFEIATSETEMGRSGYRMYAHGVTRYEW